MSTAYQFSPKEQVSLRQRVLNEIRSAILTGQLKPGDRLVESSIAEQMGISRGTLREALRQLEQEGLVISESYRHTQVANVDEEEIEEVLFPARRFIEVFMVKKAVPKLSEDDLNRLGSIVEEMRQGAARNNITIVVEKDIEFHYSLLNIANYKSLLPLWQGMTTRIRVHFYKAGLQSANLQSIVAEHQELLEVLYTKDLNLITDAVAKHIHL